jgi:hypothetical protein
MSWVGESQAISWSSGTTLTGGVQYDIAASFDGEDTVIVLPEATSGGLGMGSADYTGGFPSTLADLSDDLDPLNIRCGVEAAITALSISVSDTLSTSEALD